MNVRRFTDDFVNNCIELNKSGLSLAKIAKRFSCSAGHLSIAMKKIGYQVIADNVKKDIPHNELIELYRAGWSVKQLAEKFGISRKTISARLVEQGIKPRNRSEAMFNRMKFTTEEERKNLAKSANEAVRGKPAKRERLIKGSITRRINPKFVGFGEELLQFELGKLGIEAISQFVFDIYNIDLLVNRNIAVEVLIGHGNPFSLKKNRIKTEKLLNSDFNVIWITANSREAFTANLCHLVAYLNEFCSNPPSTCQYRVIRCNFNYAHRKNDRGQFTSEFAFKNPFIKEWSSNIHLSY